MLNNQGNNNITNDFARAFLALKDNIFKSLNVAEVCKIIELNDVDGYVICETINDKIQFNAVKLYGLELQETDIVLVLFTNSNFRTNVDKYIYSQETTLVEDANLHTKANGVVIGIIYREPEPEEEEE